MSNQLQKIFGQISNLNSFDAIKVSISSPDRIRSWSFGEVKKPETINYRTFKPERDGLFCSRIFGPVKDYECLCGKYKRMKYRGVICEKCGVEVTLSKVRRERMGHIELASPVAHIWFTKSPPSRIALLLDITSSEMDRILYFEDYVVIDPGMTPLKQYQLLSEDEYYKAQDDYGEDAFAADIGAEALHSMLSHIDLKKEKEIMRLELKSVNSDMKRRRLVKRLKLVEAFLNSGTRPEWMIMHCIPVIPPELRPLVPLDGGRFATSDLNDLYRRVINRNNRLRRLLELKAPEIIVKNEKRMLQESVDALFDNGRRGKVITGTGKRPLKSLSDMLRGKQGRFRQNLLGKRVDYSGRSVIVVGPELKLHQCGIPKKMALELFQPFIYSRLERYGLATTLKAAKRMVEKERSEVWDILEEVIKEHPVLLNRAPTLHRLGIQAFEPVLVEGKAIKLHPLVCTAFNADFDGDQMAVHVPLSLEAQLESRVLMMSTNNILSPSSGRPIILPTKDITLGIYYLTMEKAGEKGENMIFSSVGEIEHALEAKIVCLHAKIKARYHQIQPDGSRKAITVDTTPGRMILSQLLPKHPGIDFSLVNKLMTNKEAASVVETVYRVCGQKSAVIFSDKLKDLGFLYSTKSGISYGKDDLVIPSSKKEIVRQTKSIVAEYEKQYMDGLITAGERYNKVVDAWDVCSDKVADAMMKQISKIEVGVPVNPIYMMAHSGARGSITQMRQVAGMRGLMAKPSGEIIETPIISNFKEGLTVLEYFTSTHGARKGMADTALKTSNSGYLTRRLVDVAQDCVIVKDDCGTQNGILIRDIISGGDVISPLSERVLGRTVVNDVLDPLTRNVIVSAGELVDEKLVKKIEEAGVNEIRIRSVLTCECKDGICASCYGRDLARGVKVSIGEAVGVIAAQSIGEPGTQLTMRTFHIGGTAQKGAEMSSVDATYDGTVLIRDGKMVTNSEGYSIVMNRSAEVVILDDKGKERAIHKVPFGSRLYVYSGDKVVKGSKLADWDQFTSPVLTERSGIARYVDLIDGISLKESIDESTGVSTYVVSNWRQQARYADLKPRITLEDEYGKPLLLPNGQEIRYSLSADSILAVNNGDRVSVGDILARVPRETSKTKDITGGLPRVSELFEARVPKDAAVISEYEGRVEFGKDYKGKRRIIVHPEDDALNPMEYLVPRWRQVAVKEGDIVSRGDVLIDGNKAPHDILYVLGVEALADYLINEIQDVYRLQGVKINDKHIEIIVRQMLQKVKVSSPGDTTFLMDEQVDRLDFEEENNRIIKESGVPAVAHPVLQGITKASLQTRSFISAASFQETTRVLTEAAITGRIDRLTGLKENVLVGRLIPAGTGLIINKLRKIALAKDAEALENNARLEKELALKKLPPANISEVI
ncbi:MAG: DNA-directed RNA polymerase subunit beta' [Holosporaceae bacterium]|jgi:DNA-directed RNA polymerase subunit beta'|nr:DNA-directed RNA polymerase subunit beta' [Holosporaceae bacterium]